MSNRITTDLNGKIPTGQVDPFEVVSAVNASTAEIKAAIREIQILIWTGTADLIAAKKAVRAAYTDVAADTTREIADLRKKMVEQSQQLLGLILSQLSKNLEVNDEI